ncbi:MAG: MFS transporter [Alphaproteobacteria bacterium]
MPPSHGIGENLVQFLHQLLQVALVGLTLGMMRTVVPALSETEFGVPRGSFMLLAAFVVAFGIVKAILNLLAGWLSEHIGRKPVLTLGWVVALPIPFLIYFARDWSWIVGATLLLGVNQGLTWSMTQTSKLDLARPDQRGTSIGLNEFAGYFGVAAAGVATAYLAAALGARLALLAFGLTVVLLALLLTQLWVLETRPWAWAEASSGPRSSEASRPIPAFRSSLPTGPKVFALVSWRDRRFLAITQAGLIEKFVDVIVWIFYPVFLVRAGASLPDIGWIVAVYGLVWGSGQILTGRLSDRVGRLWPNVAGMWISGLAVAMTVWGDGTLWWSFSAAVAGLGMALLYPNLSATIADLAPPGWRGAAIGVYRFWRDLGYAIGSQVLGLVAFLTGSMDAAFAVTGVLMALSGFALLVLTTRARESP